MSGEPPMPTFELRSTTSHEPVMRGGKPMRQWGYDKKDATNGFIRIMSDDLKLRLKDARSRFKASGLEVVEVME
jgi:hypothetical protein